MLDEKSDVRRGLVAVEKDGKVAGVGVVLGRDGRILTSLSAVGGEEVSVKLPDGRNVKARVGHRDKTSDLALLVLQGEKWTEGLRASEVDPASVQLRAVAAAQHGPATTVPITVRGRFEARGKDGQGAVPGAIDVELPKGANPLAGAPLLDERGAVMGIFVKVCRPAAAHAFAAPGDGKAAANAAPIGKCAPSFVGAPVAAIKEFLKTTPSPWLGIAGEPGSSGSTIGVRVLAVAPASPADKAGLKGNSDRSKALLIVAVDGTPVSTPEKLGEAIGSHAVGEAVKLLVLEGEKLKEMSVTLKAAP